jgi:hypothetical protein
MSSKRPSAKWLSLDCRDGVHAPGCQDCDCWCHDDEWEKDDD